MGMHKKQQKSATYLALCGCPLGATARCQEQHFHRRQYASIFNHLKVIKLQTLLKNVTSMMQHIWHYDGFPGGLPPHALHFQKAFSKVIFVMQIECLYLELFRSYLALNLTIVEKYSKIQHTRLFREATGGLLPRTIHFRKLFSRATCASQIVCLYVELLKSYKASKVTMLKKILKNATHLALWMSCYIWYSGQGPVQAVSLYQM